MNRFSHIHHVSKDCLLHFQSSYQPVFILNTGRSGSAFLNKILEPCSNIVSYHEARPNLLMYPNFAYHNQKENEILGEVFKAARVELILEAYVQNKVYVETNQCLVFFCRQILELFPNAKFIHLLRHPGDFVRSAILKGWHKNDSIWEEGRIKMKDEAEWNSLSQLQKLAWVWKSTHEFIEEFKSDNENNFMTFKLEEITQKKRKFKDLLKYVGVTDFGSNLKKEMGIRTNKVLISENEPPNMFKRQDFPQYTEWTAENKQELKKYTEQLAQQYGYKL